MQKIRPSNDRKPTKKYKHCNFTCLAVSFPVQALFLLLLMVRTHFGVAHGRPVERNVFSVQIVRAVLLLLLILLLVILVIVVILLLVVMMIVVSG